MKISSELTLRTFALQQCSFQMGLCKTHRQSGCFSTKEKYKIVWPGMKHNWDGWGMGNTIRDKPPILGRWWYPLICPFIVFIVPSKWLLFSSNSHHCDKSSSLLGLNMVIIRIISQHNPTIDQLGYVPRFISKIQQTMTNPCFVVVSIPMRCQIIEISYTLVPYVPYTLPLSPMDPWLGQTRMAGSARMDDMAL